MVSKPKIDLFIAVATGRGWASRFGYSLAGLTLHIGLHRVQNRLHNFHLEVTHQAYLVSARQNHLSSALEGGYTHFLSLDDDMTFPSNLIDRFLEHEDKDVVTCNYRKKIPNKIEYICGDLNGNTLDSTNKTGIEQINSMGMGATFINLNKIKHIPAPHFAVLYDKDKKNFVIEDGVFSHVLRDNGVELWVDHDLSREIGHIGEVEFKLPPLTIEGK